MSQRFQISNSTPSLPPLPNLSRSALPQPLISSLPSQFKQFSPSLTSHSNWTAREGEILIKVVISNVPVLIDSKDYWNSVRSMLASHIQFSKTAEECRDEWKRLNRLGKHLIERMSSLPVMLPFKNLSTLPAKKTDVVDLTADSDEDLVDVEVSTFCISYELLKNNDYTSLTYQTQRSNQIQIKILLIRFLLLQHYQ